MVKKSKMLEEKTFFTKEPLEDPILVSEPATPQPLNEELIKQLEGVSKLFDDEYGEDLLRLEELGIAVNFGACGWARGCNWRKHVKK